MSADSVSKAVEKKNGLAFDIIIKPASTETTPVKITSPRESIRHEDIARKLQKAQERKELIDAHRMELLAKERNRAQENILKVHKESEAFSKLTQEKLRRSMDLSQEKRDTQIKALQERLREHLSKVEETCRRSDVMSKELEQRLNQKKESYEENRQAQLNALMKRLQEHASHIKEVCVASKSMNKMSEEKMLLKMETALKNREEQLKALQDRLQEHERRIEDVRKNKTSIQTTASDDA